jgi:hypothetical protein
MSGLRKYGLSDDEVHQVRCCHKCRNCDPRASAKGSCIDKLAFMKGEVFQAYMDMRKEPYEACVCCKGKMLINIPMIKIARAHHKKLRKLLTNNLMCKRCYDGRHISFDTGEDRDSVYTEALVMYMLWFRSQEPVLSSPEMSLIGTCVDPSKFPEIVRDSVKKITELFFFYEVVPSVQVEHDEVYCLHYTDFLFLVSGIGIAYYDSKKRVVSASVDDLLKYMWRLKFRRLYDDHSLTTHLLKNGTKNPQGEVLYPESSVVITYHENALVLSIDSDGVIRD